MKLNKVFLNTSFRLVLSRISIAGFVYLGTFWLAAILTAEQYGKIAFSIFVTKSVVLSSLGAGQGLIYFLINDDRSFNRTYSLFTCFSISIFSAVYFIVYNPKYYLLIYLISVVAIVEPYLKVNKKFLVSLYPEFFLVYCFFIYFASTKIFGVPNTFLVRPDVVLALFVAAFSFLYRAPLKGFLNELLNSKFSIERLKELILRGFPSYLFNLVFFLFLLADRSLVDAIYGGEKLGVVMLAYQLALIAGFVVSSINSKVIIDIGEMLKRSDSVLVPFMLRNIFISTLLGGGFLFFILVFLVFWGEYFFSGYHDLIYFFAIYGVGLLFFNVYGSVSPVLFYAKKQIVPAISILASIAGLLLAHKLLPSFGFSLLGIEGVAYSIFILTLTVSILYSLFIARSFIAK